MKKGKRVQWLALAVLAVAVLAAAVMYGVRYGAQPSAKPETAAEPENILASIAPEGERVQIFLEQDGSSVKGEGAKVSGNTISIGREGTYQISGTLEDGQIYVDAGSDEAVFLVLAGVDVRNTAEAAIYVRNAGHTSIILEEGTDNRLQSGKTAQLRADGGSADDNASGAALYSRDDLTISGTGSVRVYGYLNNGIHTTNHLLVDSGNISVEARNNGMKGKDSVKITGGDFTILSDGDGIKSDDTAGEGYGTVSITGGTFSIDSSGDALQAETALEVSGGSFEIISGGGSGGVSFPSEHGWGSPDSGWDMSDETETSTKGLKCGTDMVIAGGEFSVDSRDDSFHSDGSILISGGTLQISAGDDGIHADTELAVEGGSVQIAKSYEGLEANQILVSGGDISIAASDDGINAYGGQSTRGWGGSGKTTEEMPNLRITGGDVYIDADGDGLDSNGNISIEGGDVAVDGSSDSWNGAIDFGSDNGGVCEVSGGTVIAVGNSGMAETFGESSGQYSFQHSFNEFFESGDKITVSDKRGHVLFSHTASKTGNSVVFSCAKLKQGETYILEAGHQSAEITLDSISTASGQSGGRDRGRHPHF